MNNDQKLEEYIRNHRSELEESPADEKLWSRIVDELDQPMQHPDRVKPAADYSIYWKVAAILLLALSSVLGYYNWQSSQNESHYYNSEFASAEAYYNELIHQKTLEIQAYTVAHPDLEEAFLKDIDVLDQMYTELKEQAKSTSGQERVFDAMIQNLQLRIDILNQQITVLEQIKNKGNNANATI